MAAVLLTKRIEFAASHRYCKPEWDEAKNRAVFGACVGPALREGVVVQWFGVRRNEGANRARAPFAQRVRFYDRHDMLLFRPLIHWTAENVFSFARAHGLEPNPLYLHGMGRVGCFPCINAGKDELAAIGRRFPWAIDRLLEYEAAVMAASKRGTATFFAADKTPEGAALAKRLKRRALAETRRERPQAPPHRNGSAGPHASWRSRDASRRAIFPPGSLFPSGVAACQVRTELLSRRWRWVWSHARWDCWRAPWPTRARPAMSS